MNSTSLVITTISHPNEALISFAEGCVVNGITFFVIGDKKSPGTFRLTGADYFSFDRQQEIQLKLPSLLPPNHYSRKNIGYLLARNSDIIIESDDDNIPTEKFWQINSKETEAELITGKGWLNIYEKFSSEKIWPRGFPPELISKAGNFGTIENKKVIAPIQQSLADGNPDVDAIYRLINPAALTFDQRRSIALEEGVWCPFNSQNTTWHKEAFSLLYLPSFCSFRMTDIWRSFVAQRIAWACGWNILFSNATVFQERNEHNLLKDFEDEIPGYLHNGAIARALEEVNIKMGIENIPDNMLQCYKELIKMNLIQPDEERLLNAWLMDMN